jgi:hypothetical protein
MSQGFYEILGVEHQASAGSIQAAFQGRVAELVRRLRAARRQGADVSILEGQERALKEAVEVLTDRIRRQRYDAYRRASRDGMPDGAESMWDVAKDALVDPLAIASLDVLRATTELNIGNPFTVQPKPRQWSQPQVSASALPSPVAAATAAICWSVNTSRNSQKCLHFRCREFVPGRVGQGDDRG